MGRIRSIKPEVFRHEGLYDREVATGLPIRWAFAGLWTECDREGRFAWRPRALKAAILPYDEIDFAAILDALERLGSIRRYVVDGKTYGCIPSWSEHQRPNLREAASTIPAPANVAQCTCGAGESGDGGKQCTCAHVHAPGEGKGKEGNGKGKDSRALPPVVRAGDESQSEAATRARFGLGCGLDDPEPAGIPTPGHGAEGNVVPLRPDLPPFQRPVIAGGRGIPGQDRVRAVFDATIGGLGLSLTWQARYLLAAERITAECDTHGLSLDDVRAIAAYYRTQCQSAPPSLPRFAERIDHWRACWLASREAQPAGDAGFWEGLRAAQGRRIEA